MRVLLISTYELGRQPFGVASAAAWLERAGEVVECADLAVEKLDEDKVRRADLVAFHVPMHTATRIAVARLPQVKRLNPTARLCLFGLYAPANEGYLRSLGVGTILGGEFEAGLVAAAQRRIADDEPSGTQREPVISLDRQAFQIPNRRGLPALARYAMVDMGDGRRLTAGYTEATRGCKHLCRHCPVVPVYGGRFRVIQQDVVLADIRQQVTAGAQHITFGDPDFLNAPAHALKIVRQLHDEFPGLSYDVTIKIEHLKKHGDLLPVLKDTGCLFVTSAVESVDDATLERYDKHHTRRDFIYVAQQFGQLELTFNPTFVTFSPWTTIENYGDLLALLGELGLADSIAPIQLAIRLLIPRGSRLLELPEMADIVQPFDAQALCYPWQHRDPRVDELYEAVRQVVDRGVGRRAAFAEVCQLVRDLLPGPSRLRDALAAVGVQEHEPTVVPALTEPWYCCAEPTDKQLLGTPITTS